MTRSQAGMVGAVRVADAALSAVWAVMAHVVRDDERLHQHMTMVQDEWKRLYDYVILLARAP